MEYTCGVCGKKVGQDLIIFKDHTDAHIIDAVKRDHPEWVDDKGICQKCVSFYQQELKGSE